MKTTCGIFLFRSDGKFLIGHPTNSPDNLWTIPKGLKDSGESDLVAAFRELYEETNIFEKDMDVFTYRHVGLFKYKSQAKVLSAFYINSSSMFKNVDMKCQSMVKSYGKPYFPEIDNFKWVTIEESKSVLIDSQLKAIEVIEKIRNDDTESNKSLATLSSKPGS